MQSFTKHNKFFMDFLLSIDIHSFTDFINFFIRFLRDTGTVLDEIVNQYDTGIYVLLFVVIFIETGLVVTPFLPGDSMLFLAGTIAHRPENSLSIVVMIMLLIIAAVLGDACNYAIGKFFGKQLFSNPNSKIFKQKYIEKTNKFYEKHGGKTIIIARFVPIVRTFAPFVAGMGKMKYKRFFSFNIIGGIAWVSSFLLLGYFVGGFKFVQDNIKYICILIVFLSICPAIYQFFKEKLKMRKENKKNIAKS